jgi:hypothetical protein
MVCNAKRKEASSASKSQSVLQESRHNAFPADQHFQLPGCSSPRRHSERSKVLSWENEAHLTAFELAARLEKLECARLLVRAMAKARILLESFKYALSLAKVSVSGPD